MVTFGHGDTRNAENRKGERMSKEKVKAKKRRLKASEGDSPWYRKCDLMRLFQVTDRTIEKWVAMERLPEPKRQGRGWVRWPKKVIDAKIREWSGEKPEVITNGKAASHE